MKVSKPPQQPTSHPRSLKWKDARGKRCRATITSSDLASSPVVAVMAQEHRAAAKKRPNVKRLKQTAKAVVSKDGVPDTSGFKKKPPSSAHTNGRLAFAVDNEFEDSQDWSAYAQSVLENGAVEMAESATTTTTVSSGRLEGEAIHDCAERDERRNHTVLVMQKDQTLCFRGKCLLSCLYGRVEVMGFTIEEGQQSYPLFSPASHCPLSVTALGSSDSTRGDEMAASSILRKYLLPGSRKKLLRKIGPKSSVILLEPMETSLTRFLSSFPSLSELFSPSMTELVSAVLDTPLNALGLVPLVSKVPGLTRSHSYSEALNTVVNACRGDMDGYAVILVCGTKNVGKSTFIRILINTLLNHTTGIDYLEGDLGQTEFTPSGCLSLSTIREPLLGPPFTHQRTPDHMIYYGQSSCESDLERYLESLKSLWHRHSQSRETPIIINTMGWVKGLGLQLLVDLLRLFPVSHVVQMGHGGSTHCPPLTPEFLRTAQGCQTHPPAQTALDEFTESHSPPRSYVHLLVQSEFELVGRQGTAKHQRSNEQRELSLLAYLSQLQPGDSGPVRPLHSLTPYQVPHSAVAVGVTHCEVALSHMLYAANGSLVGLCCLGEQVSSRGRPVLLSQAPICPCVGFGVLRGIDMVQGLYYLLTPVEPSVLRMVNCLLLGAVSTPSCILTTQVGFEGELPYITTDYSFDLSGAGKLRVFKGLARPGHMATK